MGMMKNIDIDVMDAMEKIDEFIEERLQSCYKNESDNVKETYKTYFYGQLGFKLTMKESSSLIKNGFKRW